MDTLEITLDYINDLILSKHNVDLKNIRNKRATYKEVMLRRCFYQLAHKHTTANDSTIARYLFVDHSTISFYKKTSDVISFSPYYSQVFLDLSTTIRKLNDVTDPIVIVYTQLLELESIVTTEITRLKSEIVKLYEQYKSIS